MTGLSVDPELVPPLQNDRIKLAEWESTVSTKINKSIYDLVLAEHTNEILHDVIFIFSDGRRMAGRTVQTKTTMERKRVLGFYDGKLYPICRTRANESIAEIETTIKIEKAVHRLIVHNINWCNDDLLPNCLMRLAFNKEETNDGVRYSLTCEAEYPKTSSYKFILENEKNLMQKMQGFAEHWRNSHEKNEIEFKPDKLTLGEMFSCIVNKVQMWHCFNPDDDYLWAYKWNGVKAKFMYVNGHAYIWPDASEIYTTDFCGDLSFMDCICLQVELMEDYIVIVEVIAASFYGEIYSAEPLTSVEMLRFINKRFEKDAITVGGKPMTVQKFFNTRLPKCFDDDRHDGFIIVQQDLTIKWKPPSIDVKCIEPEKFVVGSNKKYVQLCLQGQDRFVGEPGSIYEMSSNFKILRKRIDRTACSTTKEYEVFLESIRLINHT